MIKFYTSYFYQIRFFKPWMIPISTAVWDPKWFHNFKDSSYIFKDKNNVYNGIRSNLIHPGKSCDGLCSGPEGCINKYGKADPTNCQFLKNYKKQLNSIDFKKFKKDLEDYALKLKEKENWGHDPFIVFIVYETPNNECSERKTIQELFIKNKIKCEELKYPIKENY